jgi:hypothetical protein
MSSEKPEALMNEIVRKQKEFYLENFRQHGDLPQSLGYNDQITQYARFEVLSRLFQYERKGKTFSVHEIGSGLAHFYEFLREQSPYRFDYSGSEILGEFVRASRKKYPFLKFYQRDITQRPPSARYDYLVLSGTFNPIQDLDVKRWETFLERMMLKMFAMAKKGIGLNFLTTYSDFTQKGLYYSDPRAIYDFVQEKMSRFIVIDSSYPLYEFTLLVYKEPFIKKVHGEKEFGKYFKKKRR